MGIESKEMNKEVHEGGVMSEKASYVKAASGCLVLLICFSGIVALIAFAYRMYVGW